MVPVKVLSFRERGLSSSRFHCDSTLLVARWPRGEVRKERKMHRIVGKNISISDSFSQEKKERKKRVASLLFLPYSIPLIDQRSARPIIIKTAPLLPSLRDARAAKRRHAAKGKLFSSGKLQTGGGERTVCTRIPPGENCRADTIHICQEIYRLDRRSSPGKYTYPDLSRPWTNTYALIRRPDYDFFCPLPDPNAIRPLYNAAFNSSEISSFFSSRHFKYR